LKHPVQTGSETGIRGESLALSGLGPGTEFECHRAIVGSPQRLLKLGANQVDKAEKAEVVEELKGVFANAGSLVVAHYTGMPVSQMSDLRARMRAAGASFKVAKNRLAVRALQGTAVEGISHLFKGPTGIAYSADPVAASKVAVAYAKDNDKLVILGG